MRSPETEKNLRRFHGAYGTAYAAVNAEGFEVDILRRMRQDADVFLNTHGHDAHDPAASVRRIQTLDVWLTRP
jgi:hypothetical protein